MAKETQKWTITIDSFGGFAPAWFENTFPTYGNKNQASDMKNVDITDPNVLTQGPGIANLTAGTQAGAVSTLIRSILNTPTSSEISYAIGGNQLYRITPTAVINAGNFPHEIDKAAVTLEHGEDVVYHKSTLYYFYNYGGTTAGDIGKYDLDATFDDDWGSTVPTGKAVLQYGPHQAINGGYDDVGFTNGRYVGRITKDGVLAPTAVDFWENSQAVSITWNNNRFLIAVNRPNLTASMNQSGIYTWNGAASTWEGDPIEVNGKIGALYTKNGVTFVWWQDATDANGFNFGYISGLQLMPIKRYTGSLPSFYQIGEYKGFVAWVSDGLVYIWGAKDPDIAVTISQYVAAKYSTVGGIGAPFGTLLIASYSAT